MHHAFLILLSSPSDAALVEVVNRNLNSYLVTGQNADIIHAKLARNMSSYDMLVGKLNLEGCVGQSLNYNAFKFNNVVLWQINTSRLYQPVRFKLF